MGVIAAGAAAARSALYCELSGCINIPKTLTCWQEFCLMAGPVNQNDIGKQYGYSDLLAGAYPEVTQPHCWSGRSKPKQCRSDRQ